MEVLDYSITLGKRDRDYEVKEAARMGIESARRLLQSLTHAQPAVVDEECDTIATAAISKFQKVVSLLGRTGHARFRRRARDSTVTGCAGVFLESSNFFTDNAQVLEPRDRPVSSGHASPSPSPFTPIASSKPPQSPELQRILYQVFPQSSPTSAGEASVPSGSTHSILHPTPKAHHLLHSVQQGPMQQSLPEHILRPLAAGYRPVLPPNLFNNKHDVSNKGPSPGNSSLNSGPPESATTVSFSNMSVDRISQQTGKSLEQPSPLPPRPQASNSRKRCSGKSDENGATCAILGRCHCSKRRCIFYPCHILPPKP